MDIAKQGNNIKASQNIAYIWYVFIIEKPINFKRILYVILIVKTVRVGCNICKEGYKDIMGLTDNVGFCTSGKTYKFWEHSIVKFCNWGF